MEMLIMASGGLNSIASSLGHMEGDCYIISEYCEDVLEEMLDNLKHENKVTRPVRINIANSKILELDLLPILSAAKDNLEAFQAIVKLLVNLSMPLEVILPMHPNMTNTDWEQRHTLQGMLLKIKKHFIQEVPIHDILEQMSTQLESHGPYPMDKESTEVMNDCLVLIRNILHIEDNTGMDSNNKIVSHMLNNNIGDIVYSMLSREDAETWISAMVQVIRLMFRDQMSQDLVKQAAKLYQRGILFAVAHQESQPASTGPRKPSPAYPSESTEDSSRESAGDSGRNSPNESGIDSGYQVVPQTDTASITTTTTTDSSSENSVALDSGKESDSVSLRAGLRDSNPAQKEVNGHQRPSGTCTASSGIASSLDGSPLRRGLSSDEDSPRQSPTSFTLIDPSSDYTGKGSPQSLDAAGLTGQKATSKQEYLCRPRNRPWGSPDNHASEEDDTCSRTSGDSSTFSRSSDNSSSSTSSSETGSSFSSTAYVDSDTSKQEMLRDQLCRFAVRFCKHCLNRCIVLSKDNLLQRVNDCYVLWCMSYFLPFTSLPCISYTDVKYNLSSMVVTYLMFVTLNTWESFTMAANDASADSKSNILFRRLYLLVASLRQILTMTRQSMEGELGAEERESLTHFIKCLCQLEGLRKLYLLLLRKFRPKNESTQYLRALVVSVDELLRIVTSEQAYAIKGIDHFNCEEFVKQLASPQVLLTYNELLKKFQTNTLEENEAAFTLMYHTAIDLKKYKLIYQLAILDTFADLWEQGSDHCISKSSWKFMDHLVSVFAQNSMDNPDEILEHVAETTSKKRKHNADEYTSEDETSPLKKPLYAKGGLYVPTIHSSSSEDETAEARHIKDIKSCIKALSIKGYKPQLHGLQRLLLETCYAKLACPKTEIVEPVVWLNHSLPHEAIFTSNLEALQANRTLEYHNIQFLDIQVKSVPLIAFSQADEMAMNDLHFQEILQHLGMHSAKDSQHLFPSIPSFWTAEMCFNAAKLLGDINYDKMTFAMTPEGQLRPEFLEMQVPSMTYDLSGSEDQDMGQEPEDKPTTSRVYNPMALLPKNIWLSVVQQLNAKKEAHS